MNTFIDGLFSEKKKETFHARMIFKSMGDWKAGDDKIKLKSKNVKSANLELNKLKKSKKLYSSLVVDWIVE